jgi:hypothetical protein
MVSPGDVRRNPHKNGIMKILLGNNTLSLLAGSETWTITLARQLKKMGHHVACFSPDLGVIAEKLEKDGIHCYSDLAPTGIRPFSPYFEEPADHNYDVIISNHFHIVDYLRNKFPKTPIISTIHGIIHEFEGKWAPEHPALNSGVNQFVAVSEEVQDILKEHYSIDSVIIRNFFDIPVLAGLKAPNTKPKQILLNTNYQSASDPEVQVVRDAAKMLDCRLAAIGMNFTQAVDITKAIEDSDVVIGMGRSVLEGVAAGRLGIVHGRWGTGGVICESNIPSLQHYNFSGRNSSGKIDSAEELKSLIEKYYMLSVMDDAQKYVKENHNAALAADEYLRLADELTGRAINRPVLSGVASDTQPLKRAL